MPALSFVVPVAPALAEDATLTATEVTATTAKLTLSGRTGVWSYAPSTGTPCLEGGAEFTADLSNLTPGTTYNYVAYPTTSCGPTSSAIASKEFTTLTAPTVSLTMAEHATDHTKATLSISNHSSGWYYKADTAPYAAACSAEVSSSTTTASLTGLAGNTSYTFKAYSNSGCTTELAAASAYLTKPGKPSKPSVAAGAGSGKLTLTSSVTGTGAITKWQYKQKTTGNFGDWQNITSSNTKSLDYTVTGLSDSTSYQFKVRAVNASGNGAESDASDAAAPAARALNISSITATTATLTLSSYTRGASWAYTQGEGGTCVSVTSGTTADLTGLTEGTQYTYIAYSSANCGTSGEIVRKTFTMPDLTATKNATDNTKVALSISNYSGNWYYKYTTPSGGNCSSVVSETSATVSGLTGGTTYTFKAYSNSNNTCAEGTELATADSFTTKPGKVTDVTMTAGDTLLAVSWTAVTGATNYKIQWKSGSEDWDTTDRQTTATSTSKTVSNLTNNTQYTVRVAAVSATSNDGEWSDTTTGTPAAPSSSTPTPATSPVSFPPAQTGNASGQTGPNGVPIYNLPEQQTATEGEPIQLNLPSAVTSNNQPINYSLNAYVEGDPAEGAALADRAAATVSATTGDGNWEPYDGLVCTGDLANGRPICTVRDDNPPEEVLVVLTATVGSGASASSTSISFLLKITPVNDPPRFEAIGAQTITAGEAFSLTVPAATDPEGDPITSYRAALQQGDGQLVAPGEAGWPGWLAFDADARTFTGTPKAADAPTAFTIAVIASDGEDEGRVTFSLKVEAKTNARLPEVSRQWLARFGRTVSSQVVDSIADRLGDDAPASSIVLGGYPLGFAGESPVVSDSDRSSSSVAHSTHGTHGDLFAADPFAPLLPSTRERLNNQSIATSPTSRELLTGSSFRISLNPGTASTPSSTIMATATTQDGSGGASGSVASATTASGGGGWTVWGEAAYNRFDSEADDLSVQGGVLTGVAALDWKQDQWLLGMAVSRSQGDGEFEAPATANDDAVSGTVSSSLTALYPYARVRPQPGVELWGAAGYGRGTMTLEAKDGSGAKPDIWLTMAAVGGRGSLLTAEQTGGPALDLTADALFTRTGAEAAGSLRDAVDAATTRLRMGVEGSWDVQNADGTSVVPTLSAALRYDAGDAETGLGVELGSGLTFTSPGSGISLSADIRGLLSKQDGDDGIGLREWGASGSIRYDRDADDLDLTVALSPSWGATSSLTDQLWSEAALPFATDGTGDSASNGAGRLDGEVGYGFAAFNGNGIITPYGGLALADGSRHWRIGSRFSLSGGLDLLIEGSRNEQQRETPDHGIHLNLNTAW